MADPEANHAERVADEAQFWDKAASTRGPSFRRSLYRELNRRLTDRLLGALGSLRGQRVLYLGCGQSSRHAREMAERGADVWCVDLSGESLRTFMRHPFGPLRDRVHPVVGDVERLPFGEGCFDAAVGKAIVHHLDIPVFLEELSRVCVPGARIVFVEPLGLNPLIGLFRRLTPGMRMPTEHPLRPADIRQFRGVCESLEVHYSECLAALSFPLFLLRMRSLGRLAHRALGLCDAVLLRLPTPLRWMAWVATIVGRLGKETAAPPNRPEPQAAQTRPAS